MKTIPTILIIVSDIKKGNAYRQYLSAHSRYKILQANDLASSVHQHKHTKIHCVITDANHLSIEGINLFACPVILLINKEHNPEDFQPKIQHLTDFIFIEKITESSLNRAVYNIIEKHLLRCTLEENQKKISYLIQNDHLTGLPNRHYLERFVTQSIARAQRYKYRMAIISLNIDGFKYLNESLGFLAGDLLLKSLAKRLRETIRASDFIAHVGGDEFAIVLEQLHDLKDVEKMIPEIFKAIDHPFILNQNTIYISACIGVVSFPEGGRTSEYLIRHAKTAISRAKEKGNRSIYFFSKKEDFSQIENMNMEHALQKAIQNNELSVYYQPKLNLKTNKIHGLEALLRWKHPKLGLILPNNFIPLAELTGLIGEMGKWVLVKACADCKAWGEVGFPNARISVNLSSLQLEKNNFLSTLESALQDTSMDPKHLELELTETSIMRNLDTSRKALEEIHECGVNISIDDFGTGYSSLSYLKNLPVDVLKIDRSFIKDLHQGKSEIAIVKAIIALGHSLDLDIVAEGVENEFQLSTLADLSCDAIQGYYFSKPIPGDNIEEITKTFRKLEEAN